MWNATHVQTYQLQHEIERDESAFHFTPKDDVYAVASLLKASSKSKFQSLVLTVHQLYLRELPEPVFRFPLQDRIQHTEDRGNCIESQCRYYLPTRSDEQIASNFVLIRSKIRRLPPVHQSTLKAIIEHLARVAAKSNKNKMDAKNLAIVFGPVIFGDDEIPKGGDLLSVQTVKVIISRVNIHVGRCCSNYVLLGHIDGGPYITCPPFIRSRCCPQLASTPDACWRTNPSSFIWIQNDESDHCPSARSLSSSFSGLCATPSFTAQ